VAEAVAVVAAVIGKDGRVLVGRRPASGLSPGQWEFPGGKIQEGETPAGALVRELAEELGVAARIGPLMGEAMHAYTPERVVHVAFLAAAIEESEPTPHHHSELRWVTPRELLELDLVAGDRAFAEALAASDSLSRSLSPPSSGPEA
jgi:mutator protein MutT